MYRGVRKFVTFSLFFLGIWLGTRILLPLILPFLLGGLLALAAEPMVSFLCRRLRMRRGVAVGISVTAAFVFIALLLLLVCAMVLRELAVLAGVLPDLENTAKTGMSMLSTWMLGIIQRLPPSIQDVLSRNINALFSSGSAMLDRGVKVVLNLAGGIIRQVPDSALILGTAIISSYMISAKLPTIKAWIRNRIPVEKLRPILDALERMKTAVMGWGKAQLKLVGITWIIVTLGFVILRVPYAPLWAILVALVDAFPILGTGTVLLPWSLLSLLQKNTARAIGLLGTYAVVTLTRSALEPKLVGKHLGLDPLITLAALYIGYRIWGIGGMLFAPILTVAAVQLTPQKAQEQKNKQD